MKWRLDHGKDVGCVGWQLVDFDKSILLVLTGCNDQERPGQHLKAHQKELNMFKKWLKAVRKLIPTKLRCLVQVEQIFHGGSNDFR